MKVRKLSSATRFTAHSGLVRDKERGLNLSKITRTERGVSASNGF